MEFLVEFTDFVFENSHLEVPFQIGFILIGELLIIVASPGCVSLRIWRGLEEQVNAGDVVEGNESFLEIVDVVLGLREVDDVFEVEESPVFEDAIFDDIVLVQVLCGGGFFEDVVDDFSYFADEGDLFWVV